MRAKGICTTTLLLLAACASGQSVGTSAPGFALPDVDGRLVRLDQLHGKRILLNFWAFWCDTWREEMPELRELAARQNELNMRIVCVSVDATRLPEFKKGGGINAPFVTLLDAGSAVSHAYGIRNVPTVLVLDEAGQVVYRHVGWPGQAVVLSALRSINGTQIEAPHASRTERNTRAQRSSSRKAKS